MNYPKKNRFQSVPIAALCLCLYNFGVKTWFLKNLSVCVLIWNLIALAHILIALAHILIAFAHPLIALAHTLIALSHPNSTEKLHRLKGVQDNIVLLD